MPAPLVSGRCWLPGPCSARGPGAGAGGGPLTIQSQGQTSLVRLPRQGLRCLPCGQRSQEGEGHIPSPLRCCLFCSTSGSTGPASRPEGGAGDPQVRAGSCSPPGDAATLTWGPAPLPREPQCILGCADHEPLVRETRQFSSTGQFETFWNSRGPTVGAGTPSSAWARCPPMQRWYLLLIPASGAQPCPAWPGRSDGLALCLWSVDSLPKAGSALSA